MDITLINSILFQLSIPIVSIIMGLLIKQEFRKTGIALLVIGILQIIFLIIEYALFALRKPL